MCTAAACKPCGQCEVWEDCKHTADKILPVLDRVAQRYSGCIRSLKLTQDVMLLFNSGGSIVNCSLFNMK